MGKSAYVSDALDDSPNFEWEDESLTGGTFHEVNFSTGEVTYRFKDATGIWSNSTDRGGQTVLLSIDPNDLSFSHMTTYGVSEGITEVEVVTITKLATEAPLITFTAAKHGVFALSRSMVGTCTPPQVFER